ncbi:hypothetical protein VTO42DRAFT_6101 [Malbranchea cinnamomea]
MRPDWGKPATHCIYFLFFLPKIDPLHGTRIERTVSLCPLGEAQRINFTFLQSRRYFFRCCSVYQRLLFSSTNAPASAGMQFRITADKQAFRNSSHCDTDGVSWAEIPTSEGKSAELSVNVRTKDTIQESGQPSDNCTSLWIILLSISFIIIMSHRF